MMRNLVFTAALSVSLSCFASISGQNLLTGKKDDVPAGKKGTVLVFLSSKCPCSNSHVGVLKALANEYKEFSFVAVHSNADETVADAKSYFTSVDLPFPVIQDEKTTIADEWKAIKTPHVFVISPEGKTLYKGGVTNSNNGPKADVQFLRDALADLQAGRAVKVAEGRTLGCAITRGDKNVW